MTRAPISLLALLVLAGCSRVDVVARGIDAGPDERIDAASSRLFEDDFETCDYSRWSTPPGAGALITTTAHMSSCASEFGSSPSEPNGLVAEFAPQDELWARAYFRFDVPLPMPDRGIIPMRFESTDGSLSVFSLVSLGGERLGVANLSFPGADLIETEGDYRPAAPTNLGVWRCVEFHVRLNTPGAADGTLELFAAGTALRVDGSIRAGTDVSFTRFALLEAHGTGAWPAGGRVRIDDVVVDTVRIGCAP